MTISKEAWMRVRQDYYQYIYPRPWGEIDQDVVDKKGIELVTIDMLGMLRKTYASIVYDVHRGEHDRQTCRVYFEQAFGYVFHLLEATGVSVVVVCIDPYGRRRIEKKATSDARKRPRKSYEPDTLPMPYGQTEYFIDELPMPCDVATIFEYEEVKARFYEYITHACSAEETTRRIPDGKTLILSCGVEFKTQPIEGGRTRDVCSVIPPLEITNTNVRRMHERAMENISEGDLDVLRWAIFEFPGMNVHIHSCDGDVLLVFLLQMKRIYAMNPERICQFITQRSNGTTQVSPEKAKCKENDRAKRQRIFKQKLIETSNFEEAARAAGGVFSIEEDTEAIPSSSSASAEQKNETQWEMYYIDVKAMYLDIIADTRRRNANGQQMSNPVETYVLMFMLSSSKHDYIQTDLLCKGVGKQFVWEAFNMDMRKFDSIVHVFGDKDTADFHNTELFYEIDAKMLDELIGVIYRCKGSVKIEEKNRPSTDVVRKIAAQCVWTLQYLSNGVIPNYQIIDGTSKTENGESIYGYKKKGWAKTVYYEKDAQKDNGLVSCPPIIRPAA